MRQNVIGCKISEVSFTRIFQATVNIQNSDCTVGFNTDVDGQKYATKELAKPVCIWFIMTNTFLKQTNL